MSVKYGELFEVVQPALESKMLEFRLYNYNAVTESDIWHYCINKKWRKRDIQEMRVSELVNDILETSPAHYMTHTQIEQFKTSNWFEELNQGDLQELLNPTIQESKLAPNTPNSSES